MSKRKRRSKRLFPRSMASDYINTSRVIDHEKIAAYSKWTKSIDRLTNGDGQVMLIKCSCDRGPFKTLDGFKTHVETQRVRNPDFRKVKGAGPEYILDPNRYDNHMPVYVEEKKSSHEMLNDHGEPTGVIVPHKFIPTPKAEAVKAWQGERHQGFITWYWSYLQSNSFANYYLGFSGGLYRVKKERQPSKEVVYSVEYGDKQMLLFDLENGRIVWKQGGSE